MNETAEEIIDMLPKFVRIKWIVVSDTSIEDRQYLTYLPNYWKFTITIFISAQWVLLWYKIWSFIANFVDEKESRARGQAVGDPKQPLWKVPLPTKDSY